MKTAKGIQDILKKIMSCCEITEDLANDFETLKNDCEEKESLLNQCGVLSSEGSDDCTFTPKETDSNECEYKQKFDDLKQQYIDRFFGGQPDEEPPTPEPETNEETIDDLFKNVEG